MLSFGGVAELTSCARERRGEQELIGEGEKERRREGEKEMQERKVRERWRASAAHTRMRCGDGLPTTAHAACAEGPRVWECSTHDGACAWGGWRHAGDMLRRAGYESMRHDAPRDAAPIRVCAHGRWSGCFYFGVCGAMQSRFDVACTPPLFSFRGWQRRLCTSLAGSPRDWSRGLNMNAQSSQQTITRSRGETPRH